MVLLMLALGCTDEAPAIEDEPRIADLPGIRAERTFYVKTPAGALFGGFDGALDRSITAGGRTITPDADGRFRVELPGEALLETDVGLSYRLRDPSSSLAAAVRPALSGAGSVPNDLLIAGEGDAAYGVLVRSGDGGVSRVDLAEGLSGEGVRVDGRPFFAAILDPSAQRIAVSDFDGGGIQLIDLTAARVERTLAPPQVTLAQPFVLSRSIDVDGDGTTEAEVVRFVARSPQSLVVAGDRLLAAYSGFAERRLDAERGPVFLPGVIASWSLSDLDAAPQLLLLDALDPQEVRILDDGRAVAVCSGVIDPGEGVRVLTEGTLTFFDPDTLAVVERISMGDFAPSSALFAAERVVVASLARARVRILGGADLVFNDEEVDSVFRLVDLGGGLIGVPSFNTDRLHVLDARTGELDPAPFFGPLVIGPGRPLFDGLQIVAARPGRRGVDFTGPDLLALTGLASELIPIELRKVLGP